MAIGEVTDVIEAALVTKGAVAADILGQAHQQGMVFIE